jgi:hypothetical protein
LEAGVLLQGMINQANPLMVVTLCFLLLHLLAVVVLGLITIQQKMEEMVALEEHLDMVEEPTQ